MSTTLARRLEKLETVQRTVVQERHDSACTALGRTMSREHVRLVQDWIRERLGSLNACSALPGESPYATFQRLQPPSLVRAVWLLVDAHIRRGSPVALPPDVAEIYLADPDAYPVSACGGCRYPLPMRGTLHPNGSFSNIASYTGVCPVCERDTSAEEAAAS